MPAVIPDGVELGVLVEEVGGAFQSFGAVLVRSFLNVKPLCER